MVDSKEIKGAGGGPAILKLVSSIGRNASGIVSIKFHHVLEADWPRTSAQLIRGAQRSGENSKCMARFHSLAFTYVTSLVEF